MDSCAKESREALNGKIEVLEKRIADGARTVDPLASILHMEILWANPEEAEGIMHVTPELRNPFGSVHGGCLFALADSVAGHNIAAAGRLSVTLNGSVNFLHPALGEEVRCRSRIRKLGKKISVIEVEAEDEQGVLLFTGSFTFSTIREIPPHLICAAGEEGCVIEGTEVL